MMQAVSRCLLLLGIIGLCCAFLPVQLKSAKQNSNDAAGAILAPLFSSGNAKPLPGRYIVRLKNELNMDAMRAADRPHAALMSVQSVQAAQEAHRAWLLDEIKNHPGSKLEHTYDLADFVGYSIEADDELRDKIRREPMVEFMEMDQPMWAFDQYVFDADSDAFVPVGQGAAQNAMEQLLSDLAKAAAMEQDQAASSDASMPSPLRQGMAVPQKGSMSEEELLNSNNNNRAKKAQDINANNKLKYQWNNMPAAAGHKKNHHHHHHQDKYLDDDNNNGHSPRHPPVDADPKKPKKEKHMLNCSTQSDAPWGLSRISSKKLPRTFGKFVYPSSAGKGVDVYIVDTGINVEHEDFEGRATWGVTIPAFDMDIDGNGHGTHCAGTVGSKTYGIAKKANLIAVKVLRTNGFGTNADVIKGIEWVVNQHQMKSRQGSDKPRSVINMSLGGGKSVALERVVDAAVSSGVHFSVAAGNDNADACNYSPAGAESAVTVGATTNKDKMAYFSNNGPCVNLFAPGQDITSTWIGSGSATNTISGTSMASPHVAGVIALHLGEQDFEPSQMKKILLESALEDMLTGLPPNKSPNLLLNIHSLIKTVSNSAAGKRSN